MNPADSRLIAATDVLNLEHPALARFIDDAGCCEEPTTSKAVERLHDAVRDTIDYTVFNVPLHVGLRASDVLEDESGFCLHKSVLFVAGCRRLGVPAVLCSDVVTNHVADAAMLKLVGGEEFVHWYARIHLEGKWIKSGPIFNALLCALYGIDVLEFNPNDDAIEQPNSDTTKMVYRGRERTWPDPKMADLIQVIGAKHPRMLTAHGRTPTSQSLIAENSAT